MSRRSYLTSSEKSAILKVREEEMNIRLSNILAVGVVSITGALAIAAVARMDGQLKLDRAYRSSEPALVRNGWGQQRMTQEQMCSATIKQWMEVCDE
ncbi:hypothetical protein LCGC14_1438300 [marine sediment metagenome]|uniref:Uncharacterized protein n=1 Tax=marine sediment metagenome TaxID=412755 RepID=A0A0F9MNA4_9ZZZZ